MDSLAATQGSSKDQSNAETWLSPKEAAARIGVAVSTLSAWRTTRRTPLRYSRPSRQVIRYALSDVETFMCGRAECPRAAATPKANAQVHAGVQS